LIWIGATNWRIFTIRPGSLASRLGRNDSDDPERGDRRAAGSRELAGRVMHRKVIRHLRNR
jgi:hypothetical protein